MASKEELACVYAALILHDAKLEITAPALTKIIEAAHVKVPAYLPTLFASMLANKNLEDLLFAGGAVAAAPVAAAGAAPASAPAAESHDDKKKEEEKKKKEEEEEEEMDMGGLFDFCLLCFCFIPYVILPNNSLKKYTIHNTLHPITPLIHLPNQFFFRSVPEID